MSYPLSNGEADVKSLIAIAAASLAFASLPVRAQVAHSDHAQPQQTGGTTAAAASGFAEGEVKKIDKSAGKITLKHGPLPALDMPAMTMVFRAKDAALLDQVKTGDVIRFKAEKIDGNFTVTDYQPAK